MQEISRRDSEMLAKFNALTTAQPDIWTPSRPLSETDNNAASRAMAKLFSAIPLHLERCKLFENTSDRATLTEHGGERFLIPPHCRYISSTFHDIHCLLENGVEYDLIVMDPPWENKSAKRLKTYDYLADSDLLTMPLSSLAADGALIAVWVTNNERLHSFVETQLFPAWNVVKEAEWSWVKVRTLFFI